MAGDNTSATQQYEPPQKEMYNVARCVDESAEDHS
jgi:hypothetical protein